MKKLLKRLRRWLARRWECATQQCSYYEHYLAYGPAHLTHIGFHSAERHCAEAQRLVTQWYDAHPKGQAPEYLMRYAGKWEERVRA